MLKRLIKLANRLDQLGFYAEASELDEIIREAVPQDSVSDIERNTDNMGYMGGDAVGGGYSGLSAPTGQPAEDGSEEKSNVYKEFYEISAARNDELISIVTHLQRENANLKETIYAIGEMYKIPVEKYFETS